MLSDSTGAFTESRVSGGQDRAGLLRCSRAKRWRPEAEFDVKNPATGALYKSCRACRAQAAAWRQNNPTYYAAWLEKNLDKVKAKGAAWYQNNRDRVKAKKAAWYQNNRDRVKAKKAAYRETVTKLNRQRFKENPDWPYDGSNKKCRGTSIQEPHSLPRTKKNFRIHPGARVDGLQEICKQCQRVVDFESGYGVSYQLYLDLLAEQDNKCALCERVFQKRGKRQPHLEHKHDPTPPYVGLAVRGIACKGCNNGPIREYDKVLRANPDNAANVLEKLVFSKGDYCKKLPAYATRVKALIPYRNIDTANREGPIRKDDLDEIAIPSNHPLLRYQLRTPQADAA